jgi:hypothetical protein
MSQINNAPPINNAPSINSVSEASAEKNGPGFTQVKDAIGVAGAASALQAAAAGKEILAGPFTRTGKDGKVYQLQLENTPKGPAVRVNVSSSDSGYGMASQIYIGQDKFDKYCERHGIADNPFPLSK